MRKTFKELVEGWTYHDPEDSTEVIPVEKVIELLFLVREETLIEYADSIDPYHFSSLELADYNKKEILKRFPKNSIKVDDPNKEYCCCEYP